VKILEPEYEHIEIGRFGKRRRCTICAGAVTILTNDDEAAEFMAWRFDHQHRHNEERRELN
jgi:hypothetical protein